MDSNIARWLCLKRFSEEEVGMIHEIERAENLRWKNQNEENKHHTNHWRSASLGEFSRLNDKYGTYWDRQKAEDERQIEIRGFERMIYPIWRPILGNMELDEMSAMHKADWAIWKSNHDVNRSRARTHKQSQESSMIGNNEGAWQHD